MYAELFDLEWMYRNIELKLVMFALKSLQILVTVSQTLNGFY